MNFTFCHDESNAETPDETLASKGRLFKGILVHDFTNGLRALWNNAVKRTQENTEKSTWRCCHAALPSHKRNTPWLNEEG